MEYPLQLSFKIIALAPQISVTDSSGNLVYYVKQKAFKLKEEITIFADAQQSQAVYKINADRVLDFSARYHFTDLSGISLGSVKREGMKSLWKSHYNISDGEGSTMTIREENPWVKVLDGLFSNIPILGMFSGYVLHPAYVATRTSDGVVVMRLEKQPAFFESKFLIKKQAELEESEEMRLLLSLIMMILLERARG